MTGSSARKLKRGAANLLAGRAFTNYLFPLTFLELDSDFDLKKMLSSIPSNKKPPQHWVVFIHSCPHLSITGRRSNSSDLYR
jgi:hypothetical protein